MKKFTSILSVIMLSLATSYAGIAAEITIPEGTEIGVQLTKSINSSRAVVGQRIPAVVSEDLIIDDMVAIKAGTPVKAKVTSVTKKKRLGKGGEINMMILSTKAVDGTKVVLDGGIGGEGKANTASTVALTVAFGLPGLLRRGEDAHISKKRIIPAIVDEDVTLTIADPIDEEPSVEQVIDDSITQEKDTDTTNTTEKEVQQDT